MSTFFSVFAPRLIFSGKESNFGSRPCLRQAGVMVGGKVGLGEMALHSRANHHRRLHRLSPHFHERPLGWAGLWRASVARGQDVQELGL